MNTFCAVSFSYVYAILENSHCDITTNYFGRSITTAVSLVLSTTSTCQICVSSTVAKSENFALLLSSTLHTTKKVIEDSWYHQRHEVPLTLHRFECTTLSLWTFQPCPVGQDWPQLPGGTLPHSGGLWCWLVLVLSDHPVWWDSVHMDLSTKVQLYNEPLHF